jgi:Caulimovirus viroplasmin
MKQYDHWPMTEKATKNYERAKNKGFKTEADNQIPERIYDFTKPENQVKAAGLIDREDSNGVINDNPSESIAKDSTSTKKSEAKLRTTSDKEC